MKKLKVAQVGLCHEHANGKFLALQKMTDTFEFVGIVDERESCTTPRNADYSQLVKDAPHLTEDQLFAIPDLDAVIVEVPNLDLVPVGLKVMEHNLPMHLDKPAGLDLTLYKTLLDGCEARGLAFQMGYMFRGNPCFRFLRKIVAEGAFGTLVSMDMDMDHCYGGDAYQDYVGKFPGGIMFNLGCHLIDFIVALMGEPTKVIPFLSHAPQDDPRIQNNTMAVLQYPTGTAVIRACSRKPQLCTTLDRHCRIGGTNGCCEFSPIERFDGKPVVLTMYLDKPAAGFEHGYHTIEFPPIEDRYVLQLQDFADMIRGTAPSAYSFEHDYIVHKVSLAASGMEGLY